MTNKMSATERYQAQSGNTEEVVPVTCPTGFVIEMAKPSKFALLFEYGTIPQQAASGAVQSWIDQGVLQPGEIPEDQAKQIDEGIKLRDRVIELSRNPKLVIGDPLNDNELDARRLKDKDATYLFAWVAAGGDTSAMLGKFPSGPPVGSVAGNGGPKRRKAGK